MKVIFTRVTAAALLATLVVAQASAESKRGAPNTPATHHHGLPGNNPGFGGASANPQGTGKNGGGGIHGIGNVPGKNAANHPSVGTPGFRDQIGTVHGGLGHQKH
jgi:hypothetical protein